VVVPIWNPGPYLDRCVNSLLAQTLEPGQYDVVLVDDGSTDGTGDRLDALAEQHSHFTVVHQPNSGWPGRPRNVGVDRATGDWVQFVDQDDSLAPDALRRLVALGDQASADIVIGKVSSNFRPIDQELFTTTRMNASLLDTPLINSVTPHKMFRRGFLLDHDLRFPEGKRRLEDQLFMVRAYLAANVVAVLADYNCYFYLQRDDKRNAGSRKIVPARYYRFLEEVLDAVVDGTEPGELRDHLLRRFLRNEVLRKSTNERILRRTQAERHELWQVAGDLVERRFPPSVVEGVTVLDRLTARLLRNGDEAGLLDLAERRSAVSVGALVESADPIHDAAAPGWRLAVSAELQHRDGSPVELIREADGSWLLDPRLFPDGQLSHHYELANDLAVADAAALLIHRGWRVTWPVPASWTSEMVPIEGNRHRLVFRALLPVYPGAVAGRPELDYGAWDVRVRVRAFGLRPIGPAALGRLPLPRQPIRLDGVTARLRSTAPPRQLRLVVSGPRDADPGPSLPPLIEESAARPLIRRAARLLRRQG